MAVSLHGRHRMIKGSLKRGTIEVFKAACRAQFLEFSETENEIIIKGENLEITITRNEQDRKTYDIKSDSTRLNLRRQKKSMCEAWQIQGRVMDLIHAYKADSLQRRRRKLG